MYIIKAYNICPLLGNINFHALITVSTFDSREGSAQIFLMKVLHFQISPLIAQYLFGSGKP